MRLQDVTQVDAAARTLAEVAIPDVTYDASGEEVVPFALAAPAWSPRDTVVLSAHLDRLGDGRVDVGDALTVRAYPVSAAPERPPFMLRLTPITFGP